MSTHLLVVGGPDQGRQFPLPAWGTILIGTSHKNADICLHDVCVARVHCELELRNGQAALVEVADSDGTFVNDRRITRHVLQPGDLIAIGNSKLRFESEEEEERDANSFFDDADSPMNGSQEITAGGLLDQGPVLVLDPPAVQTEARQLAPLRPLGKTWLDELPGTRLAHFDVGPIIAKSRSGMVFKARDRNDRGKVALKVLHPEFPRDEREKQRVLRAMRTMLPLNHANLVTLYAAGRSASKGLCWMALEYVKGRSLATLKQEGRAFDWSTAAQVALQVARALAYAEQHDVVHRNVTPRNILIREKDGVAKLGDLMLAKAVRGILAKRLTQAGELVGDVVYMSPERTYGSQGIDGRSDIYSLGATVYDLLTGRPPYQGQTSADTMTLIRKGELVKPSNWLPTLSFRFEEVLLRMLARKPADRFQTAGELVVELERVCEQVG